MAGYSNGLIRLYDVESGKKTVEIAAHARSITALNVARESGLVSRISGYISEQRLFPTSPPAAVCF